MKTPLLDRRPLTFAACVVLFFVSSAALVPGVAGQVSRRRPEFAQNCAQLTPVATKVLVGILEVHYISMC
jgi:hypothetical protein